MNRTDITNYTQRFDISEDEFDRISERAETEDEFIAIWEKEDWWTDENNA